MNSQIRAAISFVFVVMELAILVRVFISWIPVPKDNKLIGLLYQVTEPILAPIRSIIEKSSISKNMMFDFSPIIAFLIIGLIRNIILSFIPQ
jgi:YggT family protein